MAFSAGGSQRIPLDHLLQHRPQDGYAAATLGLDIGDKTMRLAHALAVVLCAAGALTQVSCEANAKVTRVEKISSAPYGYFKSGEFVRWDVRVSGELSPTAEAIPDFDKATRNS